MLRVIVKLDDISIAIVAEHQLPLCASAHPADELSGINCQRFSGQGLQIIELKGRRLVQQLERLFLNDTKCISRMTCRNRRRSSGVTPQDDSRTLLFKIPNQEPISNSAQYSRRDILMLAQGTCER